MTAGVKANVDGSAAIQVGGSDFLTVTSGGNVTFPQAATFTQDANLPNTFGFKNRIINGAMVIDQRNAGAAITPVNGQYTVDRFKFYSTQASKFTCGQGFGGSPAGFSKYLAFTSASAYSVLASDFFAFGQQIEGFNVADLMWGTASAQTVTLSFQVLSSLTGTFGGAIRNSAANRSYPFTYSVSVANTWTTISVTIPGDTSGTWLTNNGVGLNLTFGLGSGSTFSSTAGAWTAGNFISATGAVSVVGTNGATFYITGVQLEKGSTATSFDFRDYGRELAMCQRYYFRFDGSQGIGTYAFCSGSIYGATTTIRAYLKYPVTMRSGATLSYVGSLVGTGGSNDNNVSAITNQFSGVDAALVDFTVAAGTIGQGKIIYVTSAAFGTNYIQGTSEL
jgi:hypothetical protein